MHRRLFAASTFVLLAAASAVAQLPGLSGLPTVEYNPLLLINPQVQRELGLPPAKAAQVQQAFFQEAMRILPLLTGGQGSAALSPQAKSHRVFAGVEKMENRLAAMLTPPQRVRLRQLTLQSIGAAAALQPKAATQLGLTANQKIRLMEAVGDANERVAARLGRGMTGQDLQRRMPEMTRLQAQAKTEGNQAFLAILTPSQRMKWKTMLGKPFNMSGFLGVGALGMGR